MVRAATTVTFVQLDAAIRRAWRQAGRRPTWPRVRAAQDGIYVRTFRLLAPHLAAFGRCSDAELATSIPCARSRITRLRQRVGIPRYVPPPVAPEVQRRCLRLIREGQTLTSIAAALALPWSRVRHLARTLGWASSWVARRGPGASASVGRLRKAEVASLLRRGLTLTAIARCAGVSHQRIAQICTALGLPSQTERRRPQRAAAKRRKERDREAKRRRRLAERARRRARRITMLRRFLTRARRLHDRGWGPRRIAKRYGIPHTSMGWWIHRGRTELGWFPKRSG